MADLSIHANQLAALRGLLLEPNPDNLAALNVQLEAFAASLSSLHPGVDPGPRQDSELPMFLLRVRSEMLRIQHLLNTSLHFFNGLNGLHQPTGYTPGGLLQSSPGSARVLARL